MVGLQLAGLIHPDDAAQVVPCLAGMVNSDVPAQPVEHRLARADYTHILVTSEAAACEHKGQPAAILVPRKVVSRHTLERHAIQTRTEALYARRLLASENAVFVQLASNATLSTVLRHLCLYIEQVYPNAMSVLSLLDAGSQTLRVVVASTLPAAHVATLENSPVDPGTGACGYAMYLDDTVFINSTTTDSR